MKIISIQFLLFTILLSCCFSDASANLDSAKIKFSIESIFAKNQQLVANSSFYSSDKEVYNRREYLLGFVATFPRNKKKTIPWLSPALVLNTGWFMGEMNWYSQAAGWYLIDSIYPEYEFQDTFKFSSILFIPQIGLQIAPFLNSKSLGRFNVNLRFGYQINWVRNLISKSVKVEGTRKQQGQINPWVKYSSKTTFPTFKERQFSPWYIHLGISNKIRKSNFGYGISYSWQLGSLRGLELTLNYHIR